MERSDAVDGDAKRKRKRKSNSPKKIVRKEFSMKLSGAAKNPDDEDTMMSPEKKTRLCFPGPILQARPQPDVKNPDPPILHTPIQPELVNPYQPEGDNLPQSSSGTHCHRNRQDQGITGQETPSTSNMINPVEARVPVVPSKRLIYVFGGNVSQDGLGTVACYNIQERTWEIKRTRMPCTGRGSQAVWFRGKVLVAGGIRNDKISKSVFIYNPVTDTWRTGENMLQERSSFGMIVYRDKIYAVGGRGNNDKVLSATETYSGTYWEGSKELQNERYHFGITLWKDKIFVAGGIGILNLYSVECFMEGGRWTRVLRMSLSYNGYTLLTANDNIFVVEHLESSVLFRFDERRKSWQLVSPIPKSRMPHDTTVAVAGSQVYFLGGTESCIDADSYNVVTNEWSIVRELPGARHQFAAVVLNLEQTSTTS